jgi:hypothetical protein
MGPLDYVPYQGQMKGGDTNQDALFGSGYAGFGLSKLNLVKEGCK